MVEILGDRVLLRRPVAADAPAIFAVLSDPEVTCWWAGETVVSCREMVDAADPVTFLVDHEGAVAGVIQYSEETEADYRHASIDVALHPGQHGRGLGTDAVRTLARYLVEELGHHRLTIDPAAHNRRAIRCYEKVGFRPVGIMRQYERGEDGTWHDGLLMDLLAVELR